MARTPKKAPAPAENQDAIELLKADHKEVSRLFEKYEDGKETLNSTEKGSIAEEICGALTVHAQVEEEIFYPACKESVEGAEDLLAEAKVEHQTLKDLIAQIEQEDPGMEEFDAKVKVLGEYVKHHVKEEEGELFPKAKRSDLDLEALGTEMASRKEELKEETTERSLASSEA